jgi:AcrR family transcriptional regulator
VAEDLGRRERKKLQTRAALVEAAERLFERQGYEHTTVAEIADAADVSTRTFFLHFPTKEDVLLAHGNSRMELGLRAIAERGADETPRQVLARAVQAMVADAADHDLASGLAGQRAGLAASSPSVQARMVQRLFPAYQELIMALSSAYPDELDPVRSAALVGAVVGAVSSAALVSLRAGDSSEETRQAMITAIQIALPPTAELTN